MFTARNLRDSDDDSVGGPQREICVLLDEARSAACIGGGDLDQFVHAIGNVAEESGLSA